MRPKPDQVIMLAAIGAVACQPTMPITQAESGFWLDDPIPATWNAVGGEFPSAPTVEIVDPRCAQLARPAELAEDRRVQDSGWDLVGTYQGGWQVVIVRGAAGYDGMCRPLRYQAFVFIAGAFAGTLSPEPMNSRADGALDRVNVQDAQQLTAEYRRYTANDPLCCPSGTTTVVFEIDDDSIVRPIFASTSQNQ